jgi:HEAT repeat protein
MRLLALLFFAGLAFGQGGPKQTSGDRAWQTLERGFHDTNPLKRVQAVQDAVVLLPESRVVALLEMALDDKDSGVRAAGCTVLGAMKAHASIAKLKIALNDSVPEVAFAAAKALYAMDDPLGRNVLLAVLAGEQTDSSGFLSSSIRDAKLKLHDPKGLLLLGAETGAGFAGPFGAGVPLAEGLMKDRDASGKTAAALLLATDTKPESLEALRDALKDKNWTVRSAAARAIATRDAVSLYDDVAVLLDDKREEMQYSAAAALIRLRQPKSIRQK